jgi:hypothetical protein
MICVLLSVYFKARKFPEMCITTECRTVSALVRKISYYSVYSVNGHLQTESRLTFEEWKQCGVGRGGGGGPLSMQK